MCVIGCRAVVAEVSFLLLFYGQRLPHTKCFVYLCSKQKVVYTYRLLQTHMGHYTLTVNAHTHPHTHSDCMQRLLLLVLCFIDDDANSNAAITFSYF